MKQVHFLDLGLRDYKETWDLQEKLFGQMIGFHKDDQVAGHLIFVEHPHVFTLGKSGNAANLLANESLLKQKGAQFYHINRGGDITYHGPGQLVGYPIIKLDALGLGVRSYIYLLEESVIQTLNYFGLKAARLEGAAGVWLGTGKLGLRKICAIGVRASRMVTMHGFAFNINTDLTYYNLINPCGFTDKGVTSMEKELGEKIDMDTLKKIYSKNFCELFGVSLID